jgi:hypothetical protein
MTKIAQGASGRSDPARVLEEIKRISVELLGAVPNGLYSPVEFTLQDSSARGGATRHVELQALVKLRQQSSGFVMRYRQQIAQGFDDFRSLRIRNRGDLPLSLVAENQLAYHLAGQQLADAIETRFAPALETMGARLDKLADDLQMQPGSNPIGAGRLAGAFIETFRDAQMPNDLQPLMFRAYEQELSACSVTCIRASTPCWRRRATAGLRRVRARCRRRTSKWRVATRNTNWYSRSAARAWSIPPSPRSSPSCARSCTPGASRCRNRLRHATCCRAASCATRKSRAWCRCCSRNRPTSSCGRWAASRDSWRQRSAGSSSRVRAVSDTIPSTPA